jgi:hypothetical protein
MNTFDEYRYDTDHLSETEAFQQYRTEKALHPDSIVTLEKLDCGHWAVRVYSSVSEKEALLRKKLDDYITNLFSHSH